MDEMLENVRLSTKCTAFVDESQENELKRISEI